MTLYIKSRRTLYILLMGFINYLLATIPFNTARKIILKLIGAKVGVNVTLQRGIRLDFPWRLTIGANCHIGKFVYLDCRGGTIVIEQDSDVSEGAIIYTLSHDIQSENFCTKKGDVLIGARSWICARAIVLPGACIGKGNVLSANSVFSGASSEYNLLIGNLAKPVKKLLSNRASRVRK